jgi:predicted CopG family antitoxin
VRLSEEAYRRLKALKREGETFSDAVNRLTGKQDLRGLVFLLTKDQAAELERHTRQFRRRLDEDLRSA